MDSPIVCPFCPLHCDDVVVDAVGRVNVDCPIAIANFAVAMSPPVYRIGHQTVSAEEAKAHAKQVVASTQRPKVTCSAATLGPSRHWARLAACSRIDLSVDTTPTMAAMRTAMAREGFIGATLGDVKRHADLIWVIGDPAKSLPRLSRFFSDRATVRTFETFSIDDVAQLNLNPINQSLGDARYVAIVFANDAFDSNKTAIAGDSSVAVVAAEWWTRWIIAANKTRRVVQVVIDPLQTIRSVVGWTSNQTLASNTTASDIRYGDSNGIATRLQLGGLDPGESLAEAHFPIQIPGIDVADAVVRGDGAVTLGLGKVATGFRRTEMTDVIGDLLSDAAQT